jgi:hypothetical protein
MSCSLETCESRGEKGIVTVSCLLNSLVLFCDKLNARSRSREGLRTFVLYLATSSLLLRYVCFPIFHLSAKMLLKICSAFVALSCTAFAIPAPREYHGRDVSFESSVREKLGVPPAGWVKNESVAFDKETSMMSLRIHLAHQDMDTFHDLAMNVRDSFLLINT